MIIIVFGLPGSGKSYFASRLAEALDAVYINSDELRTKLLDEKTFADDEKLFVYDAMLAEMKAAVKHQKPVVLDATFYKRSIRKIFETAAKERKEHLIYIEVTAPEHIIKERVSKPRPFSAADFSVYLKLKTIFEPLQKEHLILKSTNDNISAMLSNALHYIDTNK